MSLTAKQLEERRNYIGGSDVGAIFGYSSYNSPLDIFNAKIDGKDNVFNTYTYWGSVLEPLIRDEFDYLLQSYTDLKVKETDDTKYHKDHGFLAANVDGLICEKNTTEIGVTLNKPKAILEIKTVSPHMRKKWGEENHNLDCLKYRVGAAKSSGFAGEYGEVPPAYYYQCALYMAVYDIDLTYLAVYFGNDMPFKVYKIERDLELETHMLDQLIDFWQNNVMKRIPPAPRNLKDIIKLYPHGTPDETIIATNEIADKSFMYDELKADKKRCDDAMKDLAIDIKAYMKTAKKLLDISGNKIRNWSRFTVDQWQSEEFKIDHPDLDKKYRKKVNREKFI